MTKNERLDLAGAHLDRVLGFFERVDNKASALFAIDAALLGVLCLNLRPADLSIWYIVVPGALSVGLLAVSLYFTYRCTFPSLDGGNSSLIYFREIAKRTEAKFIDEFLAVDEDALAKDMLGQIWRNSEILKIKFDSVKVAFILTAVALVPWAIFVAATAISHGQVPALS